MAGGEGLAASAEWSALMTRLASVYDMATVMDGSIGLSATMRALVLHRIDIDLSALVEAVRPLAVAAEAEAQATQGATSRDTGSSEATSGAAVARIDQQKGGGEWWTVPKVTPRPPAPPPYPGG